MIEEAKVVMYNVEQNVNKVEENVYQVEENVAVHRNINYPVLENLSVDEALAFFIFMTL